MLGYMLRNLEVRTTVTLIFIMFNVNYSTYVLYTIYHHLLRLVIG